MRLATYVWLPLLALLAMATTATAQQVPFGRSGWRWDSRQVTQNPIKAVSFWTADSGYVMTETELLLTTNGGQTFTNRPYTPPPLGFNIPYQYTLGNSFWFSSQRGVVVTGSPASFGIWSFDTYTTTDGGRSWGYLLNSGAGGSSWAPYANAPIVRTNASLTVAALTQLGYSPQYAKFSADGGASWFSPDSVITPTRPGPKAL